MGIRAPFVVLCCLNWALLPVAEPIPQILPPSRAGWARANVTTGNWTSSASSITSQSPTDSGSTEATSETLGSPTSLSSATSITAPSVSTPIRLVTTAKPTNEPWSVSYAGYTSLDSSGAPAPTASGYSGVRFQPDGASPGFFCEYPSLPQWESCNSADSRDCWLRKTATSTDDDGLDQIDINTDCKCAHVAVGRQQRLPLLFA